MATATSESKTSPIEAELNQFRYRAYELAATMQRLGTQLQDLTDTKGELAAEEELANFGLDRPMIRCLRYVAQQGLTSPGALFALKPSSHSTAGTRMILGLLDAWVIYRSELVVYLSTIDFGNSTANSSQLILLRHSQRMFRLAMQRFLTYAQTELDFQLDGVPGWTELPEALRHLVLVTQLVRACATDPSMRADLDSADRQLVGLLLDLHERWPETVPGLITYTRKSPSMSLDWFRQTFDLETLGETMRDPVTTPPVPANLSDYARTLRELRAHGGVALQGTASLGDLLEQVTPELITCARFARSVTDDQFDRLLSINFVNQPSRPEILDFIETLSVLDKASLEIAIANLVTGRFLLPELAARNRLLLTQDGRRVLSRRTHSDTLLARQVRRVREDDSSVSESLSVIRSGLALITSSARGERIEAFTEQFMEILRSN